MLLKISVLTQTADNLSRAKLFHPGKGNPLAQSQVVGQLPFANLPEDPTYKLLLERVAHRERHSREHQMSRKTETWKASGSQPLVVGRRGSGLSSESIRVEVGGPTEAQSWWGQRAGTEAQVSQTEWESALFEGWGTLWSEECTRCLKFNHRMRHHQLGSSC